MHLPFCSMAASGLGGDAIGDMESSSACVSDKMTSTEDLPCSDSDDSEVDGNDKRSTDDIFFEGSDTEDEIDSHIENRCRSRSKAPDFGTVSGKPFECGVCCQEFDCRSTLTRHMKIHYSPRPYQCEVCFTTFTDLSLLQKHYIIHSRLDALKTPPANGHVRPENGEKPFVCFVCGKCYSGSNSLSKHMRKHTEIKSHSCDKCAKTFLFKGELNRHQKTHSNDAPYMCSICCKSFKYSSHLKEHIGTHNEDRPFSCDSCGKSFKLKSGLKAHKRMHDGTFACTICGTSYTQKPSLRHHMWRKHHLDDI
ncbi:zinc finger protein 12-like [Haliotis rufescens]|uniref:zinc finger protein 12-like n=1 Tax=Haliotis rufescens TaxID=6454 RepID=UPI001EB08F81|nr:zinc finger protein 12-like [Haliotis rufescens]XP_046356748.1 zinc finger protein 12-like [Haliotis rufescens]XP_046356749.1 zinc finger protein 12-like [Haliotis rufescens]